MFITLRRTNSHNRAEYSFVYVSHKGDEPGYNRIILASESIILSQEDIDELYWNTDKAIRQGASRRVLDRANKT